MKERTPDFGHVFVDLKMALDLERVFVFSEQLHTTQHNELEASTPTQDNSNMLNIISRKSLCKVKMTSTLYNILYVYPQRLMGMINTQKCIISTRLPSHQ